MRQMPDLTPEKRIKEEIRKVCTRMEADLRGYRVVLFGSRTAGAARDRSDFDVGVLGDTPLPLATFYKMEDLFEEIPTLYRIDWVDLNRVSPEFRREALKQAEVLCGLIPFRYSPRPYPLNPNPLTLLCS